MHYRCYTLGSCESGLCPNRDPWIGSRTQIDQRLSLSTRSTSTSQSNKVRKVYEVASRSSNLITPKRPIVYHNHPRLPCIKAAEPHFVPSSLCIPQDIRTKLSSAHMQHERLKDFCGFPHAINKGLEPMLHSHGKLLLLHLLIIRRDRAHGRPKTAWCVNHGLQTA